MWSDCNYFGFLMCGHYLLKNQTTTTATTTATNYIHLTAFFSRMAWVSQYQKGNHFLILLEQEIMEWQWHQLGHMQIICTSFQTDNHASSSPLSFCLPVNSSHDEVVKRWSRHTVNSSQWTRHKGSTKTVKSSHSELVMHTRCNRQYHFQWPTTTPNPDFKVTIWYEYDTMNYIYVYPKADEWPACCTEPKSI